MAVEGDITLQLDTSLTNESINRVRTQLRDLANAFSTEMRKALDTAISYDNKSLTGLKYGKRTQTALDNIIMSAAGYQEKGDKLEGSITGAKKISASEQETKALDKLASQLKQSMAIIGLASSEATKYQNLLGSVANTEQIFQDISRGYSTPAKGVGQAGLALERTNRIINRNRANPFASDEFKTAAYTGRNYALTIGNRARRGFRADEAAQYNADATAGVLDYMIANEGLNESLALLGIQWNKEGGHGPTLDRTIYQKTQGLNEAIANIGRVTSKLNDPEVYGAERSFYEVMYKDLRKKFNEGVKVVFADKKFRDKAVEAFEGMSHLTKPGGSAESIRALSGAAVGGALGYSLLSMYQAKWQADISRSGLGTREAQYGEAKTVGRSLAGALGAIIGGVAGTVIAGPAGTAWGAAAGAGVGGWLGAIPGDYLESRLKANKVSIQYALDQHRNEAIFGTGYSTALAKAIQDQGLTHSSDVANMANNALTLRARMMLGMVGENEMVLYSFMPEYFQAAMSGAQGANLINAYRNSALGIQDTSLRALTMQTVGGGSQGMMAFALSPYYDHIMRAAGFYSEMDYMNRALIPGMMDARSTTIPIYGAEYMAEEMKKTSRKQDPFIYTPGYMRATQSEVDQWQYHIDRMGVSENELLRERNRILNWGTTPMTIVVNVDGVETFSKTMRFGEILADKLSGLGTILRVGSN